MSLKGDETLQTTPIGVAVSDDLPGTRDLSGEFRKYIGKRVSYATHGIHRYPAKFIPQIPRFCIERYSDPGDTVLDPFMGSGTTLLEAFMTGRESYGIDVHPLARLIAKVKTTPLDPDALTRQADGLLAAIRADRRDNGGWVAEIPNREHWFRPEVLRALAKIKRNIWALEEGDQKDFFKICLSSIIRKVSNSDDDSLIPEVTSFQKKLDEQGKTSHDAVARFENVVRSKLIDARNFWQMSREVADRYGGKPGMRIIGRDARDIDLEKKCVDLAVTSPPYASAVHYVSVHKLEMHWLELIKSTADIEANIIGTARAYRHEYKSFEPQSSVRTLEKVLKDLFAIDQKSAYIVHRYFDDMRANLDEVSRVLKRGGRYCMIVGENTFRRVRIPTYRIISDLSAGSGFELEEAFVYDVINRHLDIPRWNDSRIERDHVLVLVKKKKQKLDRV